VFISAPGDLERDRQACHDAISQANETTAMPAKVLLVEAGLRENEQISSHRSNQWLTKGSSVRPQRDRKSAHQRNPDLCAALDNPQRHDLPLQRLNLHRVHAISSRDNHPDKHQHVDLGFNHLHLERRP